MNDAAIIRAFNAWCRKNRLKRPTATDAVQFFVERQRDNPKAKGEEWKHVHGLLTRRGLIAGMLAAVVSVAFGRRPIVDVAGVAHESRRY